MTSVDNCAYLPNGGYLQKGRVKNIRPEDLGSKAHYLPPSRWYRDEKIFQLEKRALFSTVSGLVVALCECTNCRTGSPTAFHEVVVNRRPRTVANGKC